MKMGGLGAGDETNITRPAMTRIFRGPQDPSMTQVAARLGQIVCFLTQRCDLAIVVRKAALV